MATNGALASVSRLRASFVLFVFFFKFRVLICAFCFVFLVGSAVSFVLCRFQWILPDFFKQVLMDFTVLYRVSLGFTEFYLVLPSFI